MKRLAFLLLAAAAILSADPVFTNATRLRNVPICAPLAKTNAYVLTYSVSSACLQMLAASAGTPDFSSFIPTSGDSSITIGSTGTATPTFAINFTALAPYAVLAGSQSFGVNNLHVATGTAGSLGLNATGVPSAIASGYWNYDTNGWMGWFNNTNILYNTCIAGAVRVAPAAPSAGIFHFAGSTFCGTSSLIVNGDITTGTIAPNKMAASTFDTQTDGATVTWAIGSIKDANAVLTFTVHSGSRTLNISNPVIGGNYVLKVIQDGTGGEGLTLGTGCTWKVIGGGAGAVTPSTGAAAVDLLAFTYDGTNCLATFGKNYN